MKDNGLNPDTFMKASEDIVLSYRDRDGLLALRISQRKLRRIQQLEDLLETAQDDLIEELRAGFREETGELIIDREAYERSVEERRRTVRPARARPGANLRQFVLSSREMRRLAHWCDEGDSLNRLDPSRRQHALIRDGFRDHADLLDFCEDSEAARHISEKLIRRTAVILRRECQSFRDNEDFSQLSHLIRRELLFQWLASRLRLQHFLTSLGLGSRRSITLLATELSKAFRRLPA